MSRPEMTTHERMTRMYEHREANRVPIIDLPWASTIARWEREGMPANADYEHPEDMWAEMERVIPVMKEHGGYVIGTDYSVPNSVSLEQYREFVARAKKLGSYD